jgi:hypothetical protein
MARALALLFGMSAAITTLILAANGAFDSRPPRRTLSADHDAAAAVSAAPVAPVSKLAASKALETKPARAKGITPQAAAPASRPKPAWVGRPFEVRGYYEHTWTDRAGRTNVFVAARPPEEAGVTRSATDIYRSVAEAIATPRVRCVFDRPPSVVLLEGQRVRVAGVAAESGGDPGDPHDPERPYLLEHCTLLPTRDADD